MAKAKPIDEAPAHVPPGDAPASAEADQLAPVDGPAPDAPKAEPKAAAAAARIRKALEGKEPKNHPVQVAEDEAGNPVYGERKPWATVLAADVFAVADSIPAEKRTQVVKDLRKGTADLYDIDGQKVQNQTQCLHELLRVYEGG